MRLEDANRPPVVFSAEMEVPEKSPSGTLVSGSLRAVDPDRGDSILYSIVSGNIGNTFRIAGCGGELRVGDSSLLDVDLYEEFLLEILVQDDGVPALNSTAFARIRILDVNEPPICDQLSRNVSETAAVGIAVGLPLDAYEPEGQDLLWELTYGNDDGTFEIDRFTGQVSMKRFGVLDFETARERVIGYVATDVGAPPLSCQGQLRIDVLNANDAPVVAINPTLNVLENQESGREIGRFSLVDQDVSAGDVVTITITPGTEGYDEVSILHDPQSQQAVVRARGVANLDYEKKPILNVQFRATDAGGPTGA